MAEWVVRLGRRRTSWELDRAADIAAIEFQDHATGGLDHRPSVYVLRGDDAALQRLALQARAEHSVSHLNPPTGSFAPGDCRVENLGATLNPSPGDTLFAFTRAAHAELHFSSDDALLTFVEALRRHHAARHLPTSRDAVLEYIAARLNADDAEWVTVLAADNKKQGAWRLLVEKRRRAER